MVPAYLLICFVASAMAAYSNLYTVCVARTAKHINKYAGTISVILARH